MMLLINGDQQHGIGSAVFIFLMLVLTEDHDIINLTVTFQFPHSIRYCLMIGNIPYILYS